MMDSRIFDDLMEQAVSCYGEKHLESLLAQNRRTGLQEHGFPRLTSIIGILIAHGHLVSLKLLWLEMMDFCCSSVTHVKAGNDFSIKELCFAIDEVEKSGAVEKRRIAFWKQGLAALNPKVNYEVIASGPSEKGLSNWAAYNAASECLRQYLHLTSDAEPFIDWQMTPILGNFDENGMFIDPNAPLLYDLATRCQMAILLHFGYNGKLAEKMDTFLEKAGEPTLLLQSVSGEIPYGGRSNQFVFNEAYLASVLFYEANRYWKRGNTEKAGQFQHAGANALSSICRYMAQKPVKHVKNRFPQDSSFGLESYAYFDKYMVTLASFLYVASIFYNPVIQEMMSPSEKGGYVFETSASFHKIVANGADWFLEFDTNADTHYDANGCGRIHHSLLPSELFLSVPFTRKPNYSISEVPGTAFGSIAENAKENPNNLSFCSGLLGSDHTWHFVSDEGVLQHASSHILRNTKDSLWFSILYDLGVWGCLEEQYRLERSCFSVSIISPTSAPVSFQMPIIVTNGIDCSTIEEEDNLCVSFRGVTYKVVALGWKREMGKEVFANRNGKYLRCVWKGGIAKQPITVMLGNMEEV